MAAVEPPRRRPVLRRLIRWAVLLGLCGIGIVVLTRWLENRLVFFPLRAEESWDPPPPDLGVQDVWLTAAGGTRIHAWWIPREGDAGAVLVSHGNGGNLSHRSELARDLHRRLGRSVLLYDYPGYGKSDGKPTEAGCYAAGDAAYRWLIEEKKTPADRVVLLGESLGGGVAVDLAARHDHEALVLLFTFTSLPAVAQRHYPFLPCSLLMTNRFDSLSKLDRCRRPIFIAHGTADEVVPFEQGERLFAAAREPKRFLALEGLTHNIQVPDYFYAELGRFLDEQRPPRGD